MYKKGSEDRGLHTSFFSFTTTQLELHTYLNFIY